MKIYTLENLLAIYQREKQHRPDWPATFEACEADPLYSRILRLLHDHPPERYKPPTRRYERNPALEPLPEPDSYRTPLQPRTAPTFARRHQLDRKQLASGEKPDIED